MNGKKRSRDARLLVVTIVLLLLLYTLLGVMLTRLSSSALISLIQNRMLDISNTAADMLDGDSLAALSKDDLDSPEYRRVLEILTHFQDNIELKYIYCINDNGDGTFSFSVDPTVDDPGEFGEPVVYTDALYKASLGTSAVDSAPYSDRWGTFYSAYSPVFASDGSVAGIVAVDFSADWYNRQVALLVATIITIGLISVALGILVVAVVTRRNRKSYLTLAGQLNELAVKVSELMHEIENSVGVSGQEKARIDRSVEELDNCADIDAIGKKILSMQDELRLHIELIHKQAFMDSMTGVGSNAAYHEAVKRLEASIEAKDASFALALFDLNGLKQINDNYGHECGDRALEDAAAVLLRTFGVKRVFRIGGDEFIVILKEASSIDVQRLFGRMEEELSALNRTERPYSVPLTVSKGMAVYDPASDADFKSVFKRADLAMYEDKRAYYAVHGNRRKS